ncbi:MAG: AAA domain-containing protein [Anaerolineae bacterium]|nr:AAA domain-containing protein [Anaerolineae bacterium]
MTADSAFGCAARDNTENTSRIKKGFSTLKNIYPFAALVGQDTMCRALILNAVDSRIGGVLIRGQRGTAKSTAARGIAALLPDVAVIKDCRFGCDPNAPSSWCTECRERFANTSDVPTITRRTAFINLPVSATEDRVVGTLDIEAAIQHGTRRFEPGILAAANRGLLYIDEVNLLDDHVVDVLLDSAAMGINIVEREGISFSHPARFILVGTMNPEEGELRPQLLDRFALSVQVHSLPGVLERMSIIQRRLEFETSPQAFYQKWQAESEALTRKIEAARRRLEEVTYTDENLLQIAEVSTAFAVEGHRSDLVMLKAARANAAWEGRTHITVEDIFQAAQLALPHRLRKTPFDRTMPLGEDFLRRLREILSPPPKETVPAAEASPSPAEEMWKQLDDPHGAWKDFVDTGLR